MPYSQITDQTTGAVIPAAIPNQLQDNIEALKGGTPATAPTTTIEALSTAVTNIINGTTAIAPPTGTYYWQPSEDDGSFTAANEPGTKFGGTWTRLWNGGDGEFPKAEGDATGQTRTAGLQPDQLESHFHDYYVNAATNVSVGGPGITYDAIINAQTGINSNNDRIQNVKSDGVNSLRAGAKTEPTNREFKLWKRTA